MVTVGQEKSILVWTVNVCHVSRIRTIILATVAINLNPLYINYLIIIGLLGNHNMDALDILTNLIVHDVSGDIMITGPLSFNILEG